MKKRMFRNMCKIFAEWRDGKMKERDWDAIKYKRENWDCIRDSESVTGRIGWGVGRGVVGKGVDEDETHFGLWNFLAVSEAPLPPPPDLVPPLSAISFSLSSSVVSLSLRSFF